MVDVLLVFFFFLRILSNFQSGCISLHFYQQGRRVPLSLQPHQHLLSVILLILVILTRVRLNLKVVLTHIYIIAKNDEQVLWHLLVIFLFFLLRTLCSDLQPCFNWDCCFLDSLIFEFLEYSGY